MIFGYSLAQVKKAVVSALIFGAALAAFFIHFDPNLTQALVVVVSSLFGVISVFQATNHTAADVQKALEQLQASVIAVIGFYLTVPSSTNLKIAAAIGAFASAYAVKQARNAPQ